MRLHSGILLASLAMLLATHPHLRGESPDISRGGAAVVDSLLMEGDDFDIRVDPEIDSGALAADSAAVEIETPLPSYVRIISPEMNGSDWSGLAESAASPDHPFSIVHIGDSHLQADIATNITRQMLQYDFGNAGRGLISPLRLSGTNEPFNYSFRSDITWQAERFMKPQWEIMGFTGCAISSDSPQGYIELSTSDRDDWNPFNSITIYHSGILSIDSVSDSEGNGIGFAISENSNSTTICLDRNERHVRIAITDSGPLTIFGAYLASGHPGLVYNVIGNNGATFRSYNRIPSFGNDLSTLRPDIVVVSLGCNEAFGRFNEFDFQLQIDNLVRSIRQANPGTRILLTTPMECHRRTSVGRSRRGGKRRRRVTGFAVNPNVEPVRNAILRYGRKNGIPVYDFYAAAGGKGASDLWVADGLYSKDHIHLSGDGYRLMGRLFYRAIIDAMTQTEQRTTTPQLKK